MDELSHNIKGFAKTFVDEDHELVSLIRKGDTDCFEVLVRKYEKKMLNMAYRMTGSYEDACEVVQDAFVSAFRGLKDFEGKAKFSTWLYSIVVNLSKNRIQQMKSRMQHEHSSIDDPVSEDDGRKKNEPISHTPSALDHLEKKEIQKKVQDCLNALDREFRAVVILRDLQGFSYDEIGGILSLAVGTVKSRLFRARDSLKNCLRKVREER